MIHIREQDAQSVIDLADWAIGFMDEHEPDGAASPAFKANYEALRVGLDDMKKNFAYMLEDQRYGWSDR